MSSVVQPAAASAAAAETRKRARMGPLIAKSGLLRLPVRDHVGVDLGDLLLAEIDVDGGDAFLDAEEDPGAVVDVALDADDRARRHEVELHRHLLVVLDRDRLGPHRDADGDLDAVLGEDDAGERLVALDSPLDPVVAAAAGEGAERGHGQGPHCVARAHGITSGTVIAIVWTSSPRCTSSM